MATSYGGKHRLNRRIRRRSRALAAIVIAMVISLLIGACGSSSSPSSGHATLAIGGFAPFSGPDAAFGPELMAGCITGVTAVNRAGGVLGHRLECIATDTRGDPADAVPAATQLIATHSNLVGILGPTSDEADATIPIFEQTHLPMFVDTGEARYNHTTLPYFWRLFPPDDAQGEVLALWAHKQGLTRAAAIFGTDISSQSNVPRLLSTFPRLGGTITSNERLALDQSSYRTEVARMVASAPQVMMSEADPQTDATFLSELQQLHGLIPIFGTDVTHAFRHAVTLAIGASGMEKYWTGIQPYAPTSGPAWSAYDSTLLTLKNQVANPVQQWSNDTYSIRPYDGVVIMALAMNAAHSTSPVVYNRYIKTVTEPTPGAVVVSTYPQGVAALKAGKRIQFIGAGGSIAFDQWHNSSGDYEAVKYTGTTNQIIGTISSREIARYAG
jgi:ABC-type branched-subunit amino acid transport system substrate-binding protein